MDIELLVVRECPSEALAHELVRAALAALGIPASVSTTVVTDDEQAQARGFTGSPTFLVDGRDPFSQPGAAPGLACRLYRTPSGLAGLPPAGELRAALLAATTDPSSPG